MMLFLIINTAVNEFPRPPMREVLSIRRGKVRVLLLLGDSSDHKRVNYWFTLIKLARFL